MTLALSLSSFPTAGLLIVLLDDEDEDTTVGVKDFWFVILSLPTAGFVLLKLGLAEDDVVGRNDEPPNFFFVGYERGFLVFLALGSSAAF